MSFRPLAACLLLVCLLAGSTIASAQRIDPKQVESSLLVTGTRDFAASSVMTMQRRLLAAGTHAELLCFDGMWHAFHMATTLPEARETFAAMGRFFGKHLA